MHRHEAGRCRPSRARTTALRSRRRIVNGKGRGATRKELRGERGERSARKHQVELWTNSSRDEKRPPREEWPTAMKILTVALDRDRRSFYYCFFPLLLSFLRRPARAGVRLLLSPATIYRRRVPISRASSSTLLTHMRLPVGTRKVLRKSQDAARVDNSRARDYVINATPDEKQ